MDLSIIIFLIIGGIYAVLYIVLAAKTGCFRRTVGLSVMWGLGAYAVLGLLAPLTGVWLPLNIWTLGTSAAVGLPGVVAIAMLKFIFI